MADSDRKLRNILLKPRLQLPTLIAFRHKLLASRFPGRRFLSVILSWFIYAIYACDISPKARIPRSVKFPHPAGIVIGAGVVLGERVTIYQNVTLGSHGNPDKAAAYPAIGDDVVIYAGAVVVGDITVGAGSTVGANVVLSQSLPESSVALVAKPAIKTDRGAAG